MSPNNSKFVFGERIPERELLKKQLREKDAKIKKLQEEYDGTYEKSVELQKALDNSLASVKELNVRITKSASDMSNANVTLAETESQRDSVRNMLRHAMDEVEAKRALMITLKDTIAKLRSDLADNESEISKLNIFVDNFSAENDALHAEIDNYEDQKRAGNLIPEQLSKDLESLKRERDHINSEFESIFYHLEGGKTNIDTYLQLTREAARDRKEKRSFNKSSKISSAPLQAKGGRPKRDQRQASGRSMADELDGLLSGDVSDAGDEGELDDGRPDLSSDFQDVEVIRGPELGPDDGLFTENIFVRDVLTQTRPMLGRLDHTGPTAAAGTALAPPTQPAQPAPQNLSMSGIISTNTASVPIPQQKLTKTEKPFTTIDIATTAASSIVATPTPTPTFLDLVRAAPWALWLVLLMAAMMIASNQYEVYLERRIWFGANDITRQYFNDRLGSMNDLVGNGGSFAWLESLIFDYERLLGLDRTILG